MKIRSVDAFQIFDSRGYPTLEAEVEIDGGFRGRGCVPSGASTGQFEAHELRDADSSRFQGKGVSRAIALVREEIAPFLTGRSADQEEADRAMIALDATPNKARLGANAILGVSMALADARAKAAGTPLFRSLGPGTLLPLPEIQIFGGGAHAAWRTDVQDFLVIALGAQSYAQTLEMTFDVSRAAGEILAERSQLFGVADEGGYWPAFSSNEEALSTLVEAIRHAGYLPGKDVGVALDIAASDLYDKETALYRFRLEDRQWTSSQFVGLMLEWCEKYPIVSLEDPLADTDWDGWKRITSAIGQRVQLVGDDLFTTNLARIGEGIKRGVANAVLIKLNQIGTVTETFDAIRMAQETGLTPIVSARSGETEDAFISHLAVASNAGQLKVGSFCRGERTAKWNELLRIERNLGASALFRGGAGIFDRL